MIDTPNAESMTPEGATNIAKLSNPNQLDPADKKVLCSAICYCNQIPNAGVDGRQLKQHCVSDRIKNLDKLLEHRSPYKQEISYDMTKHPPEPIMDAGHETKGHDWIPGWIKKRYGTAPEYPPRYKSGRGLIRRPDVVIVKDPSKPPTQDNIKQIVEIKFPPDKMPKKQKDAYETIAGDGNKLKLLQPSQCDCSTPDPDLPQVSITPLAWAASVAGTLAYVLSRGRTPRPVMPAF